MSSSGPVWTRARLQRVMCLRFGFNRTGGVNTGQAAAEMHVSARTVQRWLHASSGRSLAHIPAARLQQLLQLIRVDPVTVRQEAQQRSYALEAIARIRPEGRGPLPVWESKKWLEPHRVMILQIPVRQLRIRQVTVARDTERLVAAAHKRGRVVAEVRVPTKFHATVVAVTVLEMVGSWRFQASSGQVRQGFTQAWLADRTTPRPELTTIAADIPG